MCRVSSSRKKHTVKSWTPPDLTAFPGNGGIARRGASKSGISSLRAARSTVSESKGRPGWWRAAMRRDYVELHARSAFSFLRGASFPEHLAEQAAELELPAVALCDRDGLYGVPRFYSKGKEYQ